MVVLTTAAVWQRRLAERIVRNNHNKTLREKWVNPDWSEFQVHDDFAHQVP